MKTFSIKETVKEAWEMWKQHKKTITIATIIMLVVSMLADGGDDARFSIYALIFFVISLFIDMGWWKMLLKVSHGEKPKLRDLIDHARLIWKYLGATIVTFLITVAGLILLIIPGIYLLLKYIFAPIIVLDKNISIKQALKQSAEMSKGVKWKLIGLGLASVLINIVGLAVLIVGLIVTIPVTALAYVVVYKKLSHHHAHSEAA